MSALTEIKERGGVKVVRIGGGAAGTEAMNSGVISILHFGEFYRPDVPVRAVNGHRDELIA
jgi:hypothetical protein